MNKYTLGTIVGTALLGLAKSTSLGSKIKLTQGYLIRNGLWRYPFTISPTNMNELRETTIIKDCKGNMSEMSHYEDMHKKGYITQSELQSFINQIKNHKYCLRDIDDTHCLKVSNVKSHKIKELAEKILMMDATEGPLRKNLMMVQKVNETPYLRENQNLLWLEGILTETILAGYTPTIKVSGNPKFCMKGNVTNGRIPPSLQKELEQKMTKKVNDIIAPFGFRATLGGHYSLIGLLRRSRRIEQLFQNSQPIILKYENGELVPYKPKMMTSKLRRR